MQFQGGLPRPAGSWHSSRHRHIAPAAADYECLHISQTFHLARNWFQPKPVAATGSRISGVVPRPIFPKPQRSRAAALNELTRRQLSCPNDASSVPPARTRTRADSGGGHIGLVCQWKPITHAPKGSRAFGSEPGCGSRRAFTAPCSRSTSAANRAARVGRRRIPAATSWPTPLTRSHSHAAESTAFFYMPQASETKSTARLKCPPKRQAQTPGVAVVAWADERAGGGAQAGHGRAFDAGFVAGDSELSFGCDETAAEPCVEWCVVCVCCGWVWCGLLGSSPRSAAAPPGRAFHRQRESARAYVRGAASKARDAMRGARDSGHSSLSNQHTALTNAPSP